MVFIDGTMSIWNKNVIYYVSLMLYLKSQEGTILHGDTSVHVYVLWLLNSVDKDISAWIFIIFHTLYKTLKFSMS